MDRKSKSVKSGRRPSAKRSADKGAASRPGSRSGPRPSNKKGGSKRGGGRKSVPSVKGDDDKEPQPAMRASKVADRAPFAASGSRLLERVKSSRSYVEKSEKRSGKLDSKPDSKKRATMLKLNAKS